ncbi:MAG: DUF1289 domain-containing protein [Halieaceae bacterium]|nr:DUF1289 domain-containing protein [Halieaceae bacterium]
MLDRPVKTPCIGVCSTGIGDLVCRGCKRFVHEVVDWNGYSIPQKRIVDRRLAQFLAQCMANRFEVTDERVLKAQLELQLIRYDDTHAPLCWVFAILKAGASQITDPSLFGFAVLPWCQSKNLKQLRDEVDEEYFQLSQAHYERYFLQGVVGE